MEVGRVEWICNWCQWRSSLPGKGTHYRFIMPCSSSVCSPREISSMILRIMAFDVIGAFCSLLDREFVSFQGMRCLCICPWRSGFHFRGGVYVYALHMLNVLLN